MTSLHRMMRPRSAPVVGAAGLAPRAITPNDTIRFLDETGARLDTVSYDEFMRMIRICAGIETRPGDGWVLSGQGETVNVRPNGETFYIVGVERGVPGAFLHEVLREFVEGACAGRTVGEAPLSAQAAASLVGFLCGPGQMFNDDWTPLNDEPMCIPDPSYVPPKPDPDNPPPTSICDYDAVKWQALIDKCEAQGGKWIPDTVNYGSCIGPKPGACGAGTPLGDAMKTDCEQNKGGYWTGTECVKLPTDEPCPQPGWQKSPVDGLCYPPCPGPNMKVLWNNNPVGCECADGYQWADADDPNNFDCVPVKTDEPPKPPTPKPPPGPPPTPPPEPPPLPDKIEDKKSNGLLYAGLALLAVAVGAGAAYASKKKGARS